MAVAVEVDRVLVEARRHELRHAERAGVAAAPGERIDAFALAEDEPALELVLEEGAAVAPAGREVEGEGRKRIDDAKVAHLLAVDRFDADDADDDLGRHAVHLLGLVEPALVGAPERGAGAQANRLDEAGPVRGPVLRRPCRRRHDVARHDRDEARLRERAAHPLGVEAAPLGDAFGEANDVVARSVRDGVGRAVVDDVDLVLLLLGRLGVPGRGARARCGEPGGAADDDLTTLDHGEGEPKRSTARIARSRIIKRRRRAAGAPGA